MSLRTRLLGVALVGTLLGGIVTVTQATAADPIPCTPRLLILGAMPVEIDPLLAKASSLQEVVYTDGTRPYEFFAGTLAGNNVVLAMTGIGTHNATNTTNVAFANFGSCGITGVVFSGTAGGLGNIGDVAIPQQWTLDASTYFPTDPTMYAVAQSATQNIALERDSAAGDPACACLTSPNTVKVVTMPNQPVMHYGGNGLTMDPFGDRRLPCVPRGGDVFGCEPCPYQDHAADYMPQFLADGPSFIDPNFFFDYFQQQTPAGQWAASDMETAAVAKIASEHSVPFIGFRAQSDGNGDPLNLPGFPFQFFVYRQIAADNAAQAALAFLAAWATH